MAGTEQDTERDHDLADARAAIRRALIDNATTIGRGGVTAAEIHSPIVRDLSAAYASLGGDLELDTNIDGAENARGEAIEAAAMEVVEAVRANGISGEDFPPRLVPIRTPINDLARALRG